MAEENNWKHIHKTTKDTITTNNSLIISNYVAQQEYNLITKAGSPDTCSMANHPQLTNEEFSNNSDKT